jgi:hypothetical protein
MATNNNNDAAAAAARAADATAEATAAEAAQATAAAAAAEAAEAEAANNGAAPPLLYWNGTLATPSGTIASHFNKPKQQQLETCEKTAAFLLQESRILDNLNLDTSLVPFLINIPNNKRHLRILYGIGTGCGLNGLGTNPIENSIVSLTGELISGIAMPSTMVLPEEVLDLQEISIPSDAQLAPHLTTKNNRIFWFKTVDCDDRANIPSICPVPAFLLPDSFNKDIDVLELLEKVQQLPDDQKQAAPNTILLLLPFLKASIVKNKVDDASIHQDSTTFMQNPTEHDAKWKQRRMHQLFPSLLVPAQTNVPTTSTNSEWTAERLIELAKAGMNQNPPTSTTNDKNSEDDDNTLSPTLGLSKSAYDKLMSMCGIVAGQEDEIPPIWLQLTEKNLTKVDKMAIASRALTTAIQWRDAKVKPLTPILKMIVERSFEGETSIASLYAAAKGLTPFAVPCLTEAEAYSLNELAEAMASASATTIKDITGSKMKATVPQTFDKMIKRIKRFGNLLFAVFGEGSPLFFHINHIIMDLDDYSETARTALTTTSIASIIWIIHLQARYFSSGLMTINAEGNESLLPEFTYLCNAIKSKQQVYHGEVPAALLTSSSTSNTPDKRKSDDASESPKQKQRTADDADKWKVQTRYDTYHPMIKKAMIPIMQLQRQPSVQKLCRAAGCQAGQLFPTRKKLCIRAQLFGKCFTSCPHSHALISDEEAEKALKHLIKLLSDPQAIKKVNN